MSATVDDTQAVTLSMLDEVQRYARFDDLQKQMRPAWESMHRHHRDESVVVIPSVTLDRAAVARSGSLTQAYEERLLFLLLLLRQPRLRMVYVTSMPITPAIVDYYLALLPGVIPSHARARLSLVSVGDSSSRPLSEKILQRPPVLERIAELIPNRSRSHLVPYNTHRKARARPRAPARNPHVRRGSASRRPRHEDRVSTSVRRCRCSTPAGRGEPAQPRRDGGRHLRDATRQTLDRRGHHQAQRGCFGGRQRARRPHPSPDAGG